MKTEICDCGVTFTPNPKYKDSRVKCNSCIRKTTTAAIKAKAVEYLGGKCVDCGYASHIVALDFDHVNPSEKEFKISGNFRFRWKELKKELDKCVLRCANCHRVHHYLHDRKLHACTKKTG